MPLQVAVLRSGTASGGSVDMLVCSQSAYFVGQACFTDFGLAPADYDVVVVKSPNGANPPAFGALAATVAAWSWVAFSE